MPLEDDFSDIIKKARMGLAMPVGDLARISGLFAAEITALERGARPPTAEEILALAAVLKLRPEPLGQIAMQGWAPAPIPGTFKSVKTVNGSVGGYAVKGYLLHDAGDVILIDTAYNAPAMIELVERHRLKLKAICLTHGHSDHADGLEQILARWKVPVYLGAEDESLLSWRPSSDLVSPDDGTSITLGALRVSCLRTPGHTPGGICYQVQGAGHPLCFVGDTLFAGSIGRANPFPLYPTHLDSVRRRVLGLSPDHVLLPGHGPATTVREELEHNPFYS